MTEPTHIVTADIDPTKQFMVLREPGDILIIVPHLQRRLEIGEVPNALWKDTILIGKTEQGAQEEAKLVMNYFQFQEVYGMGNAGNAAARFFFEMPQAMWVFNTDKPHHEAVAALIQDPNYPHKDVMQAVLASLPTEYEQIV